MIKYIVLLLVAACFLILGPVFADQQGLLHLEFAGYVIETSLVTTVVLIIGAILVFWLVQALIKKVAGAGKSATGWLNNRRNNNARTQLEQSFLSYIEGDYDTSYSLAQKSTERSVAPLASAVMMAVSGIRIGNEGACEALLKEAEARGDDDTCAALNLLRIQGHMAQGRYQAAFALASVIYAKSTKNKKLIEIMLTAAIALNKQEDVISIVTKALKQKVLTSMEAVNLTGRYWLDVVNGFNEVDDAKQFLNSLPAQLREETIVVDAVAKKLCLLRDENSGAKLIINEIKRGSSLDEVYLGVASWPVGSDTLLKYLEKQWRSQDGQNSSFTAALANMLLHKGEINRARDLYEQLSSSFENRKALLNLAGIYEAQGNFKDAALLYKKASCKTSMPVVQK